MATFITKNTLRMVNRHSLKREGCPHPKVALMAEVFDPEGDMWLLVGKHKCTDVSCVGGQGNQPNAICFHIHSTVLAAASPALGLILYSPSSAAVREDGVEWTAHLPDDDPLAMKTFISILYGHYPVTVSDEHVDLKRLLHITILAEKYDLMHHFSPWSALWVQDMEPYWAGRSFVGKSIEDLESLLWIFWVLGHEPLYTYMILQIAFHSELDAAGKLTDPSGQLCFTNGFHEVPVPPYAPIEIGHSRIDLLKMIRKDIKETLEEHLHGNQKKIWLRCKRLDGANDWTWRRSFLRPFIEMLKNEGIWPLPSAYTLTTSPQSLLELFRANPSIPAFIHHRDGRFCEANGSFWKRIEKILQEARFTLPAQSANHLIEQATKSGLASHFQSKDLRIGLDKGSWNVREILEFQEAITQIGHAPAEE